MTVQASRYEKQSEGEKRVKSYQELYHIDVNKSADQEVKRAGREGEACQ